MRAQVSAAEPQAKNVPRLQCSSAKTWAPCLELCNGDRNQALVMACREGGLTMPALTAISGLSVTHSSRLIAAGVVAKEGEGHTWRILPVPLEPDQPSPMQRQLR